MTKLPLTTKQLGSTLMLTLMMLMSFQASGRDLQYYQPTFDVMKTNITVHEGDFAILVCNVINLGTKFIIWRREGSPQPLTVGAFVYTNDPSYSLNDADRPSRWALVIKNVQKEHAGGYVCEISTKEELKKVITLNVLDAVTKEPEPTSSILSSRIPDISIGGTMYVDEGNTIVLTCNATGQITPPEDIDWFKEGLKIKSSVENGIEIRKYREADTVTLYSTFTKLKSTMGDRGSYICRSSDLATKSIFVHVLNSGPREPYKRGTTNHSDTYYPDIDSFPQIGDKGNSADHVTLCVGHVLLLFLLTQMSSH